MILAKTLGVKLIIIVILVVVISLLCVELSSRQVRSPSLLYLLLMAVLQRMHFRQTL